MRVLPVANETFDDEVHLNSGVTDNADSAKVKNKNVFAKIKEHLLSSSNPDIHALTKINDVDVRHILLGDLFRINNLIVTHASKASFGDTENVKHSQNHHRQLLMSMHSLSSSDATYSTMAMSDVMSGTEKEVTLKTSRERAQRWLVNKKFAKWTVDTMEITTVDGIPCLTAWALYFQNYSRVDWKRHVGREIATWLECPAIKSG